MFLYYQYYLIYFFLLFAFVISEYKGDSYKRNKTVNHFLFLLATFGLFLLSALKGINIGVDTSAYNEIYLWLGESDKFGIYEPLFAILSKFIYQNIGQFQFLVVASAVLLYIPLYIFIKHESKNPLLSISLFFLIFFIESNSMMRQSIAIGFTLLALFYLFKGYRKLFLVYVLIAGLFHYSAFIMYIVLLFSVVRFKMYYFLILPLLAFVIAINRLFSVTLINLGFDVKYLFDEGSGGITMVFSLIFLALYMYIVSIPRRQQETLKDSRSYLYNKKENIYKWMLVFYAVILILELDLPVFARLSYYFSIPLLILLPNVINRFTYGSSLFIFIATTVPLVLFQTTVFLYRPLWGQVFPYLFFWESN